MKVLAWMRNNRWSFAAIGVSALWVLLSVITSHFNLNSLSGVATSASFLVIVARKSASISYQDSPPGSGVPVAGMIAGSMPSTSMVI